MVLPSRRAPASSPRAAQQDTRQPLKRRREARWHLPRNRTTGAVAQSSVIRTATNANKSPQHAEPACADESDAQVAAPPMAPGLGGFNIEPPATPESTPPLNDVREPRGLKPDIIRPPSGTERYRLCAIERNSVRARDGRLLLAPKVIVAVIGIIGI